MSSRCWPTLAVTLLTTAGCAGPSDDVRVAAQVQSIIDGEASGAADDAILMTRAVHEGGREQICSASLVAPNLLVTARHCVSYLTEGLFTCSLEGELVNGGDGAGELGLHVPSDSIEVYGREAPRDEPLARGLRTISTLSETICNNDLAFVVLDRALDLPVVPLRLARPAEYGELGSMVGFGLEAGQDAIDYRTQPRKRRGQLMVAGVGPDSLEDGVTTVAPRSLVIEGPCGCIGDSGGPLLSEATGALLGVYSLLEGVSCTDEAARLHLVHVPPFERLIADAFAAADAEPVLESEGSGAGGEAPQGASGEAHGGSGGSGGVAVEGGRAGEPSDESAPVGGLDDSGCSVVASGARRADPRPAWLLALALAALARRRRACRPAATA